MLKKTSQVLTLKNCIEPPSYASTAYVVASFLFNCFCKNLGNLQEFYGQMVYCPPLAKNCPYAYDCMSSNFFVFFLCILNS